MNPETNPRYERALVGGGVRSGKSAFALVLAERLGARRAFVATAQAFDGEMRARIAAHQAERAGRYETLEEPLALPEALDRLAAAARPPQVVVVDCLTLWLSNLLLRGDDLAAVERAVEALAAALARAPFHAVLVSNEVGMGIVPENALARAFRDASGRAHARLARDATQLYLAAMGCVLRLRPDPVTVVAPAAFHAARTPEESPT